VVAPGAHQDRPEAFLGVLEVDQVRLAVLRGDCPATDAALTVVVSVPHLRTVSDLRREWYGSRSGERAGPSLLFETKAGARRSFPDDPAARRAFYEDELLRRTSLPALWDQKTSMGGETCTTSTRRPQNSPRRRSLAVVLRRR
jgi:hypothetical protein